MSEWMPPTAALSPFPWSGTGFERPSYQPPSETIEMKRVQVGNIAAAICETTAGRTPKWEKCPEDDLKASIVTDSGGNQHVEVLKACAQCQLAIAQLCHK
jgi:hypothetical protein